MMKTILPTILLGIVAAGVGFCLLFNEGALAGSDEARDVSISEFWTRQQVKHEAEEAAQKTAWKAFDSPPKFVKTGVDTMDRSPAFYASLQDCKYLPEFQSIFTEGADGRYFTQAMAFCHGALQNLPWRGAPKPTT
jgi:hypothetical protein